jgi:hypothetical protein
MSNKLFICNNGWPPIVQLSKLFYIRLKVLFANESTLNAESQKYDSSVHFQGHCLVFLSSEYFLNIFTKEGKLGMLSENGGVSRLMVHG